MSTAGTSRREKTVAAALTMMPALVLQQPAIAQQGQWQELPRMELTGQYAGPLYDTVIQRWRDLDNGTICYVYLPITVAHSPPPSEGYVRYGSNTIGSISCVPGTAARDRGDRIPVPSQKP